ncbi:nucleotidyl transferase AbiEii/AbiGii toxin family protein [Curtobacterium sp. MCBD17_026]|uniref:nucleotidyl transferase AbiEii/AbiGii toxin family protein n=1 Tax=Curtobacterium sp. MCBD17_026 TaxID=2175621 RepID=UPI0021ACC01E|nr:nucleotidyl transferase AbiEii/AbiGii toxin family protein [Curtobacterium sp. MCBD17_026]WIB72592.1 nucleotidyl transferase AbiEii/AbiGii toxin family protein [Curtobacterium sp. MCBD17_026]
MTTSEEHQRAATRIMLDAMHGQGFALAGSGAIREHGVIARPTEDVDLFTTNIAPALFTEGLDAGAGALRDNGYTVDVVRRADQYARLDVVTPDGYRFDVDMGVDWRAHEPVTLEVGPVLALDDAVANKVGALYGRAEARDFLDVDAIRRSGRFTDDELLASAANHDPGFDRDMFVQQLERVETVRPIDVQDYEYSAEDLDAVKDRMRAWAGELGTPAAPSEAQTARQRLSASYPSSAKDAMTNGSENPAQRPSRGASDRGRDTGMER